MGKFSFRKTERLNKEIWIQELFDKGSSFYFYPFKILYIPHPNLTSTTNQVMFTVPKRQFKRAVDRNTVKRRLREAWRLNKSLFQAPGKLLIAYIYTAKTILPSATVQQKVQGTILKLSALKNEQG